MANTTIFLSFFVVCIAKQGSSHDIRFYTTIFPTWLCDRKVQGTGSGASTDLG